MKDSLILDQAREEALYIFDNDPNLGHEQLQIVKNQLVSIMKRKPNWGRIS